MHTLFTISRQTPVIWILIAQSQSWLLCFLAPYSTYKDVQCLLFHPVFTLNHPTQATHVAWVAVTASIEGTSCPVSSFQDERPAVNRTRAACGKEWPVIIHLINKDFCVQSATRSFQTDQQALNYTKSILQGIIHKAEQWCEKIISSKVLFKLHFDTLWQRAAESGCVSSSILVFSLSASWTQFCPYVLFGKERMAGPGLSWL